LASAETIIFILVPSSPTETAKRIAAAAKDLGRESPRTKFYIDANPIAPATTKEISKLFSGTGIAFIDGSIVGGPPRLNHGTNQRLRCLDEKLGILISIMYLR
jgi:3-hydroxyisobutyrate dehydrogenase-like beta-hydroxyacid dehydrogenase